MRKGKTMSHARQPKADEYVASLVLQIDIESQRRYGVGGDETSRFERVIDGHRYSSEAMTLVCDYDTTYHEFGNYWSEEHLWKTENGRWLLSGHGGSGTPWWDHTNDDSWGLGFVALSGDEARHYLEMRGFHSEVIEHFQVDDA
jgi:hypothetical protein